MLTKVKKARDFDLTCRDYAGDDRRRRRRRRRLGLIHAQKRPAPAPAAAQALPAVPEMRGDSLESETGDLGPQAGTWDPRQYCVILSASSCVIDRDPAISSRAAELYILHIELGRS